MSKFDDLNKAIEDSICYEHFFYDSHGSGCHWSKSVCPYCQIADLTAEVTRLKMVISADNLTIQTGDAIIKDLTAQLERIEQSRKETHNMAVEHIKSLQSQLSECQRERDELAECLEAECQHRDAYRQERDAFKALRDQIQGLFEKVKAERDELNESIDRCNRAWMSCTGSNYPKHAEAIISSQKEEIERLKEAYAKKDDVLKDCKVMAKWILGSCLDGKEVDDGCTTARKYV